MAAVSFSTRAGSSTAQPRIMPLPKGSWPWYSRGRLSLAAAACSTRVFLRSSTSIKMWGLSRLAPWRTAIRGGIRSTTVFSVGRTRGLAPGV